MSVGDWLGTIGVTLLLAAFALNVTGKLGAKSVAYLLLNITGSALACACSYSIGFWPFVVLELVWCLASLVALLKRKTT